MSASNLLKDDIYDLYDCKEVPTVNSRLLAMAISQPAKEIDSKAVHKSLQKPVSLEGDGKKD